MYHVNAKDLTVYPKSGNLNVRKQPATTAPLLKTIASGKTAGITTGNYEQKTDGYWFEITGKGWVRQDVVKFKNNQTGQFVNVNFHTTSTSKTNTTGEVTEAEAKKRMDAMFENDRKTFASLSKSNAYLAALKAKGVNTSNYEKRIIEVANSYTKRQQEINNHKNLKAERSSVLSKVAEKASWLWSKVTGIFSGTETEEELGFAFAVLIPIIVPVIKWAAIAISSYFLYKAFKPGVEQSHVDLKKSEELEQALSTLNPEQRKKVEKDIQTQIDTAYSEGKSNGSSLSSFLKTAQTIAVIAGGAYLFKKFVLDKKKMQAPLTPSKGENKTNYSKTIH